jgi:hypothetical protein
MKNLWRTDQGRVAIDLHYGQTLAWESLRRFIAVIAGTQSGKTSFGPWWLQREIKMRGPGDYMVVTPTFPLLEVKALPEFRRLFEQTLKLGKYVGSPVRRFEFSPEGLRRMFGAGADPTYVYFGYAADPDSLESATVKGLWCDEAGQKKFKLASWEALLRRLSIHEGRALITTTPYDLGWLKTQMYDKWTKGDTSIELVNFASIMNPVFPRAEYERARRDLPLWKFRMFYQGRFERPAGLIYGNFNTDKHTCPRFTIPSDWQRYLGVDFGGVNTAGLFYAEEPTTKKLYGYREYKGGNKSAKEHTADLLEGEPMVPVVVGGSKSEGQWRREFRIAGLPIQEPDISEVEVGINRVYGAHARDEIIYFDDLAGVLAEKGSYSRVLDADGEPTEAIEDKSSFHFLDAERYIIGRIRRGQ